MALALNTVEYGFNTDTTGAASTVRVDLAAITLYIPENSSRTFKSVVVEVTFLDNVTTATSLTAFTIGIKLGAVAFDDVTVTQTITNSGENISYELYRDVTSYFNTNFGSGTSQTCQVGIAVTGPATINHSARLIITYEYQATGQTTLVKTVRIPIESITGSLTQSLAEVGTNQVPNLDSFLPEASKSYRQKFFLIDTYEGRTGTIDGTLALSLDAEGEVNDGNHEGGLNSSRSYRRIWVRDDMTTNATHAFKARSTTSNLEFSNLGALLVVTYEYDVSSSTTIMNSLVLPVEHVSLSLGDDTTVPSRYSMDIWIPEPTTISLVQSGMQISGQPTQAAVTLELAVGSQSNRTYTIEGGTTDAGKVTVIQRIDSGGAQGAAISLVRGLNTLTLSADHTSAGGFNSAHMTFYLNYTSGKSSNGVQAHNHSHVHVGPANSDLSFTLDNTSFALPIPETNYWLWNISLIGVVMAGEIGAMVPRVKRLTGEGLGTGWTDIFGASYVNGEMHAAHSVFNLLKFFKRWASDPDTTRLDAKTTRTMRMQPAGNSRVMHFYEWYTYHTLAWAKAGNVTGYVDADGAGLTVSLFRGDTHEYLGSVTTTAGGSYSFTWFDNTINLYARCQEDSTHVGASTAGTAS